MRNAIACLVLIAAIAAPERVYAQSCEAIRTFTTLAEDAEERHLGGEFDKLIASSRDADAYGRFSVAYKGAYATALLEGLAVLRAAYSDRTEIESVLRNFATTSDKFLERLKQGLEAGLSAWDAYQGAHDVYDPLGDEFALWFDGERERCK